MIFRSLFRKRRYFASLSNGADPFQVEPNETILEAALRNGIAYPHDCTVGTCGTCRSKLMSGSVEAITPFGYALSQEEIKEGYILACQALPQSDVELSVELERANVSEVVAVIQECEDLTHDIKRVVFNLDSPIDYVAGQYFNIRWPGLPDWRSYSFARGPEQGGSTNIVSFVRKVPGGAFTERLFTEDLQGLRFEIEGPHGSFWLREADGPILLIGGGSGLAPLMSVLEDALSKGIDRDAILLFGARTEADLYCLDEIADLSRKWRGQFEFRPFLSEQRSDDFPFGPVTEGIKPAIKELGGIENLQAYLCGPPGMIDAALALLVDQSIPVDRIFYDKFTDASHSPS